MDFIPANGRGNAKGFAVNTIVPIFLCLLSSVTFAADRPKLGKQVRLSVSNAVKRNDSYINCLVDSIGEKRMLIVCISRSGKNPLVKANTLDVRVFNADGTPLEIVRSYGGEHLPEAGGSLGTTANAHFNFVDKSFSFPVKVEVTKDGTTDVFVMEKKK